MAPNYQIEVVQVEARRLAVVKDTAYSQNIGPQINASLPAVFGKLQELGITGPGQVIVAYFPHQGGDWNSAPGIRIEVGVQLASNLPAESAPIIGSSTPACRAATTLHTGPYQDLPAAHMAIHTWCHQNGHALTGHNWEVYGDHHDDPSQLKTHVYYELE